MPTSPFGFAVRFLSPDTDPVFLTVKAARLAYQEYLGGEAKKIFTRAVLGSKDRFGRRVQPIGPSTAEHRAMDRSWFSGKKPYSPMGRAIPTAPPLAPNREKSRIIALFRFEVIEDGHGLWFFWGRDPHTGKDWGEILGYHRTGYTAKTYRGPRAVPARDYLGFSKQDIRYLAALGGRWWKANRRRWERLVPSVGLPAAPTPGRSREAALAMASLRGAAVPPTPAGAVAVASRTTLLGRIGAAVNRAVGRVLGR